MSKETNQPWRSWLLIALVASAFIAMYRMNPDQRRTRNLTQLEFYTAMDQGKLVEPVTRVVDRDDGETYLTGEVELDELDDKGNPKREPYRVALVPGENEGLMADILESKVKVVVQERKSAMSPLVTQLLFFIGLTLYRAKRQGEKAAEEAVEAENAESGEKAGEEQETPESGEKAEGAAEAPEPAEEPEDPEPAEESEPAEEPEEASAEAEPTDA